MRASALSLGVVLAMAGCANDPGPTGPGSSALPPPPDLIVQYEGSESGPVGFVAVRVEFRRTSPDDVAIYPGESVVQLTVDGQVAAAPEPFRFRVNGVETDLLGIPDEIEVYAGLGSHQNWITAYRTR